MIRYLLILFTMMLVMGCSPKLDDLHTYTQRVKGSTTPQIEPYPEFKTYPAFTYSASTLRSPFEHPKSNTAPVSKPSMDNCYQPDFQRAKEALESYGIDALSLSGNFEANGVQWALIKSNDSVLHKAKIGSRIGLFYGKITQIGSDSITIEQSLPDGAGCWQRKTTTMTTASKAGE